MRMLIKYLLTASLCSTLALPVAANNTTEGNLNTWSLLLNRFYLSDKFTFTNEIHERSGAFLKDQGTFIVRPSIDYALNKDIELSIGYSFVHSTPYEPYTQAISRNEHNIWEQAMLKSKVGNVTVQHRFRFEHRFVQTIKKENLTEDYYLDGYTYSNRFRYRLIVMFDILKLNDKKHSIFFHGFDELWINQADNMMPTSYARNWIYTGLGYKFNRDFNIQLGHMRQQDKINDNTFISSSIIQLSVFKNFTLYNRK
jgi:hypothetical protein